MEKAAEARFWDRYIQLARQETYLTPVVLARDEVRKLVAQLEWHSVADRGTAHALRHSFAKHLLEDGYDVLAVLVRPCTAEDKGQFFPCLPSPQPSPGGRGGEMACTIL